MTKLTNRKWATIKQNYEYADAEYRFTHSDIDFALEATYTGKTLLWADGRLIAYTYDGADDLRFYVECVIEEQGATL